MRLHEEVSGDEKLSIDYIDTVHFTISPRALKPDLRNTINLKLETGIRSTQTLPLP